MALPEASRRDNVSVPAALAISAMPVLYGKAGPTLTGIETDRAVAVVTLSAFGVNAECMYRSSTVTAPLEKTFANPAPKLVLLCVLTVVEPPAGIQNEMFGSTIEAGI